jgi:hypothetical protein
MDARILLIAFPALILIEWFGIELGWYIGRIRQANHDAYLGDGRGL